MEIQKEMEQYEAVLKEAGYGHRSLSKSSLGYLNPITQFGFEVWFNAQKQAVPEGYKVVPVNYECVWCGCTELDGWADETTIEAQEQNQ